MTDERGLPFDRYLINRLRWKAFNKRVDQSVHQKLRNYRQTTLGNLATR
jgi:hypothetical protein